jgi:hypothetical protein
MEDIMEFMNTHPMITWGEIEQALELSRGVLKAGKGTPEKYIEDIALLLADYGFDGPVQEQNADMIVIKAKGKPDTILNPDNVVEHYDTVYQCDDKGLHINSVNGLRYYQFRPGREYLLKLLPEDWAVAYGNQANKIKW